MLDGLTAVVVHAPTGLAHRAEFFPQLARWAATLPGPVVLAGDLNLGPRRGSGGTFFLPWTWRRDRKIYADLLKTFPVRTDVPSTTFYGQVYDHIVATAGTLTETRVLAGKRSFPQDHDPLVVTFAPPAAPEAGLVGTLSR